MPIYDTTSEQAVEFCERLSRATGKSYRLPTEAEWEYGCRAGTTTKFSFGEKITPKVANYNGRDLFDSKPDRDRYREVALSVGSLGVPNGFGLFDMHGNVAEWCSDWYSDGYYSQSPSVDPKGPAIGGMRVIRGGSWQDYDSSLRSASRAALAGDVTPYTVGFRVVRSEE